MIVRQARQEDLQQIAAVHIACFPDSFSTHLGRAGGGYLQGRFYEEYLRDVPELFLVAEDDSLPEPIIVGFCMGYYPERNNYTKRYFRHNLFRIGLRIAVLLLTGNRAAWRKLTGGLRKKNAFRLVNDSISFSPAEAGDLLSICALPAYRGSGAAQMLMDAYLQVLRTQKRSFCLLTVATDNGRGVRFYERNGFVPYREADGVARTYIKRLGPVPGAETE